MTSAMPIDVPFKDLSPSSDESSYECARIDFPGEMIFTDPNEIIVETKSKNVTQAFIILRVEQLFTPEQRLYFNPVIISITKVLNLPIKELVKKR